MLHTLFKCYCSCVPCSCLPSQVPISVIIFGVSMDLAEISASLGLPAK